MMLNHDDTLSVSSFRKTLEEETQRLTGLCTQWSDILDSDSDGKIDDTAKVFVVLQCHVYCLLQFRETSGALLDKPNW